MPAKNIRRIAGKICSKSFQESSSNIFQPIQRAYGTKDGCETTMHAVRDFIYSRTNTSELFD